MLFHLSSTLGPLRNGHQYSWDSSINMTFSSEKFCLKWNDFQLNIGSSYNDLRNNPDFSDVTLVCEEDQQVEAHRIILASSSTFFNNVLKRNTHSHPMIYMKGLKAKDLMAILDFIYHGEANICQEDLDGFLALAENLQLKGLVGSKVTEEAPKEKSEEQPLRIIQPKEESLSQPTDLESESVTASIMENHSLVPIDNGKILVAGNTHMADLKVLLDSRTEIIDNGEHLLKCRVCGKTTKGPNAKVHMRTHIETHIEGLSYPCNQCGIVCRSSNALYVHASRNHRK